jgi:hypothetical protein
MLHLPLALILMVSPTDTPSAEPANKVICKKFVETGSLVRKKKICRTRADWNKESSALRESATRFVEERRGRVSSPN